MKRIKRFGVLNTAVTMAAIYAVLGLVVALLMLVAGSMIPGGRGMTFGVIGIIVLPIIYGVIGFIAIAICCAVYNFVAAKTGGIEVETEG